MQCISGKKRIFTETCLLPKSAVTHIMSAYEDKCQRENVNQNANRVCNSLPSFTAHKVFKIVLHTPFELHR